MKNTIFELYEKITLLEENIEASSTTIPAFKESLKTRASIKPLNKIDDNDELFEVVVLKPPTKFKTTIFSGIKWNNKEYKNKTIFKHYKSKFLKGIVGGCNKI